MPKRLLLAAVLFLISLNFLSSCKTSFDVNAPYKEEYVVYGLLELHNTTQIIKISKVFQNSASVTASQAAQTADSLNPPAELVVSLIEMQSGGGQTTTALVKYNDTHKDPGYFAAPGQYLYMTPSTFVLNPTSTYKLTIDNPKTKYHGEASSKVVTDVSPYIPSQHSSVNFSKLESNYSIKFSVGNNAATYDFNLRVPYAEYSKQTSTLLKRDTLVMNIFQNSSQFSGGFMVYSIRASDFFSFVGSSLKVDTSLYRKIDSLDFTYTGAAPDLSSYIQVNTPSTGIVQKKPDYTNVTNGLGVFSSRLTNDVKAPLNDDAMNLLFTSDLTKALNFRK